MLECIETYRVRVCWYLVIFDFVLLSPASVELSELVTVILRRFGDDLLPS